MIDRALVRWTALLVAMGTLCLATSSGEPQFVKSDCYPVEGASEQRCKSLGCVWQPVDAGANTAAQEGATQTITPAPLDDVRHATNTGERVHEPWCYFPPNYVGYVNSRTSHKAARKHYLFERVSSSALASDIKRVAVKIESFDKGKIVRVRVYDADKTRFEPPLPELNLGTLDTHLANDLVHLNNETGTISIAQLRSHTSAGAGADSASTAGAQNGAAPNTLQLRVGQMIFAPNFIQLSSALQSPHVFGLGEHYDTFTKVANRYKTYSFYNTDKLPLPAGQRSYGGFPFYINRQQLAFDAGGKRVEFYGVYLRQSNAMDITLQPNNSIVFRTIGGILDFFIFTQPSAAQIIGSYQRLVGLASMPPRWALGFQLCRYNYNTLNKTRLVWRRTRDAGIPFDVQWNDIDYMRNYNDFTYDDTRFANLPQFVDELHRNHMHYMLIFDPGLSQEHDYYPYELGKQMDVFIKDASNATLVGKVWNRSGRTVFPDFSNNKSVQFWTSLFVQFHAQVQFDGAWIDMNDISNFVDGSLVGCPWTSSLERPPYLPGGYALQKNSLCLSARHAAGLEYDLHNLYSFYESIATFEAMRAARPTKRSLIISRSSSPGQGKYAGHWSGDVQSSWNYLQWTIPSLLEHSMYGYSMMGSDICGFAGDTSVELCARWSTLGAFYTLSRNHNDDKSIDQDPAALGPIVVAANKNALTVKYQLIPYLYTLMYRAHHYGEPVARSSVLEPGAFETLKTEIPEAQFLLGSAVLISPIVQPNTTSKITYLPPSANSDGDVWYETDVVAEASNSYNESDLNLNTHNVPKMIVGMKTSPPVALWSTRIDINLDNLVMFYRGGHILPIHLHALQTVVQTVSQPISLIIALSMSGTASGELFMDDGETDNDNKYDLTRFATASNRVEITVTRKDYDQPTQLGIVKVYGANIWKNKIERVSLRMSGAGLSSTEESLLRFVTFVQGSTQALSFDLTNQAWLERTGQKWLIEWSES